MEPEEVKEAQSSDVADTAAFKLILEQFESYKKDQLAISSRLAEALEGHTAAITRAAAALETFAAAVVRAEKGMEHIIEKQYHSV